MALSDIEKLNRGGRKNLVMKSWKYGSSST